MRMTSLGTKSAEATSLETRILSVAYVCVLLLVPTRLAFGPLGGSATPAVLVGIVLLLLWVGQRFADTHRSGLNPITLLLSVYVLATLIAYAVGQSTGLLPDEVRAGDRAMLVTAAFAGAILFIADGFRSIAAVERLLRVMVWLAAGLALAGLVQFVTGFALAEWIRIPGFRITYDDVGAVQERLGVDRIQAMATHPIEFGVVLAAMLAPALHFAFRERAMWLPTAVIALAIPVSGSRSAIVCAGVVVLLMMPVWRWWQRGIALAFLFGAALVIDTVSSGLLASIGELFTGVSADVSTQTRVSDYEDVVPYVAQSPLIGRGPGTFLPGRYLILDNQYLLTLVDSGVVGLLALLALLVGATLIAYLLRGRMLASGDRPDADLAGALAAGVGTLAVSAAFFDLLSFPMATGLLAVLIGCVGALWRIRAPRSGISAARAPAPAGSSRPAGSSATP
jgi:hypothetical protein